MTYRTNEGRSSVNCSTLENHCVQLGGEHEEHSTGANLMQGLARPSAYRNARGGTSQIAAQLVRKTQSETCQYILALLENGQATAEELHERLTGLGIRAVLNTVRARLTELANVGLVIDSGGRGVSASGRSRSIAWALAPVVRVGGAE